MYADGSICGVMCVYNKCISSYKKKYITATLLFGCGLSSTKMVYSTRKKTRLCLSKKWKKWQEDLLLLKKTYKEGKTYRYGTWNTIKYII